MHQGVAQSGKLNPFGQAKFFKVIDKLPVEINVKKFAFGYKSGSMFLFELQWDRPGMNRAKNTLGIAGP